MKVVDAHDVTAKEGEHQETDAQSEDIHDLREEMSVNAEVSEHKTEQDEGGRRFR